MARESKTETIDGLTITVQQLPYMRATKLLHKLTRAVGPAMLKALAGGKIDKLQDLDLSSTGEAAQMFFEAFTEHDLEQLIKELLENALIARDGGEVPLSRMMDDVFAGKITTLFKVLKFALEVNFQDFFPALLAGAGALKKAPQSKA